MLTSSAVKARARELGFDLCGIAPATGMAELARIHDWIGRGHAGEMRYLERSAEMRADLTRFLPGARSVIVTATNYFTGPDPTPGLSASVARYARGQDYHVVLAERLEALLAWMRQSTSQAFDAAVDKYTAALTLKEQRKYSGIAARLLLRDTPVIIPYFYNWTMAGSKKNDFV